MNVSTFAAAITLIAVLVCPNVGKAQAPGFGFGPSDSALFDIVINLPADQTSITGFIGESIISGNPTTTQLNVQDLGVIGDDFSALFSEVNISGGVVGDNFLVAFATEVNISGGTVGDRFLASSGEVNIFGTEFFLDDIPLTSLIVGQPFTVSNRNGELLSGTLADGSAFDFELNEFENDTSDSFNPFVPLTVTLTAAAIPEPSSAVLLLAACCGCAARRRRANR